MPHYQLRCFACESPRDRRAAQPHNQSQPCLAHGTCIYHPSPSDGERPRICVGTDERDVHAYDQTGEPALAPGILERLPDEMRDKLPDELVDELLVGAKTEEGIVGPGGLLVVLTGGQRPAIYVR